MPLSSGPRQKAKGTMFTSIGSQESLDGVGVGLDCGHGWSPEPSIFCQHCSSRLCLQCYPSHNKHFHRGGGGEIHCNNTSHQTGKGNTSSHQRSRTHKGNTSSQQTNCYPSAPDSTRTETLGTCDISVVQDELIDLDSDLEFDEFHFKNEPLNTAVCDHKSKSKEKGNKIKTSQSRSKEVSWDSGIDLPSQVKEEIGEDVPDELRTTRAFHIADIHCDAFQRPTRITGMVLTDKKLIVTDYLNKRVVAIEAKTYKTLSQYNCSSGPWDLTEVGKGQVAVTLTDEQKIIFLRLKEGELFLQRDIMVSGFCDGIAYHDNKLVISCINPATLQILDINGNQLCCLDNQSGGLFLEPRHVAFSQDGQRLYVSDFQRNEIICITLDKRSTEVLANGADPDETAPAGAVSSGSAPFALENQYANSQMQGPEKIAMDGDGNIFVCGGNSNNIHLISAQCELLSIILTKEDGLKYPQSLFCCRAKNRLYVGFDGDVGIQVFHLQHDDKWRDGHKNGAKHKETISYVKVKC